MDTGPSIVATPVAASPPDPHGDDMDTVESCTTPTKRAKTIMGLESCVLEARDDVFDPTSGWPHPNLSENVGEIASDDDDDRLKVFGRPCQAPSADELQLLQKRDVHRWERAARENSAHCTGRMHRS